MVSKYRDVRNGNLVCAEDENKSFWKEEFLSRTVRWKNRWWIEVSFRGIRKWVRDEGGGSMLILTWKGYKHKFFNMVEK